MLRQWQTVFCRRPLRSNPSSTCYENILSRDFDLVCPNAQRRDHLALAGLQIEIETMPWAEDLAAVQKASGERCAAMRAHIACRVILAVEIEQGDFLPADFDQTTGSRRNLA